MSSIWGRILQVNTFGESHGPAVGAVIDGLPAGIRIDLPAIQAFVDRRRPGQSAYTTPRVEADQVCVLSGLEGGFSLGTPLTLVVYNQDARPKEYSEMRQALRPSHADYTYQAKYGLSSRSGGGRASARETLGRVLAGAIAQQILQSAYKDLQSLAWVAEIKDIKAYIAEPGALSPAQIEAHPLRCPDPLAAEKMSDLVLRAKAEGDSVGGVIAGIIKNAPVGLGEPVFRKAEALLAQAMLSIPATKGFEIGSGFRGTKLWGSEHNDPFYLDENQKVRTLTNHSGGVQGGISNGEAIHFRVAFKPTSTIRKAQNTLDAKNEPTILAPTAGRHDPCVLPRAVPIVEAMTWLVLLDLELEQRAKFKFGSRLTET